MCKSWAARDIFRAYIATNTCPLFLLPLALLSYLQTLFPFPSPSYHASPYPLTSTLSSVGVVSVKSNSLPT